MVCDNTLLGPLFQKPIQHGADISVYSLTKYVGGHSDLIAGAALGSKEAMKAVRLLRSAIGTQLDPAFLLDARPLARDAVAAHERSEPQRRDRGAVPRRAPAVAKVHHLAYLPEGSRSRRSTRRSARRRAPPSRST